MPQEESNTPMSEVGLDDEYSKQIAEANKESLVKQKELFEKTIEEADKDYDNYNKQWAVDKELYDLMLEKFNYVGEAKFAYEQDPRFWELQKEKFKYKMRMDVHMAEAKLKEFERRKETAIEQLNSVNKKLEKYNG